MPENLQKLRTLDKNFIGSYYKKKKMYNNESLVGGWKYKMQKNIALKLF